jgi:hypothetical protein
VIDRNFVQEIPLNGSFQNLIQIVPGVATATPQGGDTGNFSVNGMRTDANNFVVDGVSANNGTSLAAGAGTAGMAANTTAIGTTQSILPIDALEEFRMSTSTYTAEFGRQSGAQISFKSRSGTNAYHGAMFHYLRNTVFDANNWFNTYSTPPNARPAEHQNDFGGFIGGPLSVPKLYSGKDRAFFFLSYEGVRLIQPVPAFIYWVPSNGTYNTATYSNPQVEEHKNVCPRCIAACCECLSFAELFEGAESAVHRLRRWSISVPRNRIYRQPRQYRQRPYRLPGFTRNACLR